MNPRYQRGMQEGKIWATRWASKEGLRRLDEFRDELDDFEWQEFFIFHKYAILAPTAMLAKYLLDLHDGDMVSFYYEEAREIWDGLPTDSIYLQGFADGALDTLNE